MGCRKLAWLPPQFHELARSKLFYIISLFYSLLCRIMILETIEVESYPALPWAPWARQIWGSPHKQSVWLDPLWSQTEPWCSSGSHHTSYWCLCWTSCWCWQYCPSLSLSVTEPSQSTTENRVLVHNTNRWSSLSLVLCPLIIAILISINVFLI